jgi:hypothetical protein
MGKLGKCINSSWCLTSLVLLTFAFLTTSLLSGCGGGTGSHSTPVKMPELGKVLEKVEARITAKAGVKAVLPNGTRFEVPQSTAKEEIKVSLIQSAKPDIAVKSELLSDVYYLTAQGRVLAEEDSTLTIHFKPNDLPVGLSAESIRVYSLIDGDILYPVNAVLNAGAQTVTVHHPEVIVLQPPPKWRTLKAVAPPGAKVDLPSTGAPSLQAARTGYVLGKPNLAQTRWENKKEGIRGDIYQQPGQCFSIIFQRQAPVSLAVFVLNSLQEVCDLYNKKYPDSKNNPPFDHLSPDSRMKVYLGDYDGINGEYVPWYNWNGYVQVDVTLGLANQEQLRGTLFHEMFHAVQDVFSNMFMGGNTAHWWYEATAEWSSLDARKLSFTDAVRNEMENNKHFMSIPIEQSKVPDSYPFSLLVYHVEQQHPGYTHEALKSWDTFSGELYKTLVEAGKLGTTYADFVKNIMMNAIPAPGIWAQGFLTEAQQETRLVKRPGTAIGESGQNIQRITAEKERYGDHRFTLIAPPLTTSFYTVGTANITEGRKVNIQLTQQGKPSNNAWLVTSSEASGPQSPPFRLSEAGTAVSGLGQNFGTLWIAVFNPDPNSARQFQLTLKLEKPVKGKTWVPDETRIQPAGAGRRFDTLGTGGTQTIDSSLEKYVYTRWEPAHPERRDLMWNLIPATSEWTETHTFEHTPPPDTLTPGENIKFTVTGHVTYNGPDKGSKKAFIRVSATAKDTATNTGESLYKADGFWEFWVSSGEGPVTKSIILSVPAEITATKTITLRIETAWRVIYRHYIPSK